MAHQEPKVQIHAPIMMSEWPSEILPTIVIFLGLSSQITLTSMPAVVNESDADSDVKWSKIRTFLSLAWVFFVIGFGMSVALSHVYYQNGARKFLSQHSYKTIITMMWTLLEVDIAMAFIFEALLMMEYTTPSGCIGLAVTSLFLLATIGYLVVDSSSKYLTKPCGDQC